MTKIIVLLMIFVICESSNYCHTASGPHRSIRKCCIQHSNCPIVLEREASKYLVTNSLPYHLYYCKCEQSFYNCLSHVNSGRAVATRKAHFLENVTRTSDTTSEHQRQMPRKCLDLKEVRVCSKKILGLFCVQHSNVLQGSFQDVARFL
ncbi:unnamed protein product [Auanema sp. JU1783]|nr:unnamed protein product [Auanema sp. JU1783]